MATSTTFNPTGPTVRSGQGSAQSNREDLSSELQLLAPEKTPVFSLCAKNKATATFHEWNLDKLDDPAADGVNEGEDVSAFDDKFSGLARVGNYVQKFRRTAKVSDIQNAVSSAASVNYAKAEVKAMRELKRDVEYAICSDNEMQQENGAGSPYKMRGLGKWIQATAQATNPVPTDYLTPSASILTAAPTEITLNDIVASIFTENGETNQLTVVAGVTLRKRIAEFTRTDNNASETVYNVMQDATSKKVTLAVQIFDSDFGMLSIINGNPKCMPAATRGYVLNPSYLGFSSLIGFGSTKLENQGGGDRGFCDMVGTLECKHPKAHGKIAY